MRVAAVSLILLFCGTAFAADFEILNKTDYLVIQSNTLATEHHIQTINVLTTRGARYVQRLPSNSYIHINNVRGNISCRGASPRTLERDDIVDVPMLNSAEYISDVRMIVIVPSDLEPGCEFTVEYDRTVTSLLFLAPWTYGSSVPIRKAFLSATFPSQMNLKYRGLEPSVTLRRTESHKKVILEMEASNQSASTLISDSPVDSDVDKKVELLPAECLLDSWKLSTQTWGTVAEWFQQMSSTASEPGQSMDSVVSAAMQEHKDPEGIAAALYDYVQKNFSYVAVEIGIGGYKPRRAQQTFAKKYGDCKDLAFLYVALLKKAGIEAYAALIDASGHTTFDPDFPSPLQFNHCIVYIPGIRGGVWVDCTSKNLKLGEIPSTLQGRSALVAGLGRLIQVPEDLMNSDLIHMTISGKYSGTGLAMSGKLELTGASSEIMYLLKNPTAPNTATRYILTNLLDHSLGLEKFDATVKATDVEFHIESLPYQAGSYKLLIVNPLRYAPLEKLAISPEKDQYFSLGPPRRYQLSAEIDLGELRLISLLPKKETQGEYVRYSLELRNDRGKLFYDVDVYFANGFLNDTQMKKYQEELRGFSNDLLRTAVVL